MHRNHTRLLLAGLALGTSACVEIEDELELETTSQAVEDGSAASSFQLARAADLVGCTGTRISDRHVLTALHCICLPSAPDADDCISQVGNPVRFYTSGPGSIGGSSVRTVTRIHRRPGTTWNANVQNWYDSNGDWADIAILELNADVTVGTEATLAWNYPGDDIFGFKVGAGAHEDNSNGSGVLLQRSDRTRSSHDLDGRFLTKEHGMNKGDSGGPYYHGARVLGTLTGAIWDGVYRGAYTSVPHHLDWILTEIAFAWRGSTPTNTFRFGNQSGSIAGASERVCQYACHKSVTCVAYNYNSTIRLCSMLSTVTGGGSLSGWKSARK